MVATAYSSDGCVCSELEDRRERFSPRPERQLTIDSLVNRIGCDARVTALEVHMVSLPVWLRPIKFE